MACPICGMLACQHEREMRRREDAKSVHRLSPNVYPNRVIEKNNFDGSKDIFYNQKGTKGHKQGHTHLNSLGEIDFARTIGQRIIKPD